MPKLEGMIGKEMLEGEIRTLIDYAKGIEYVLNRDGHIHKSYLREKVQHIKFIADWLYNNTKEDEDEDN